MIDVAPTHFKLALRSDPEAVCVSIEILPMFDPAPGQAGQERLSIAMQLRTNGLHVLQQLQGKNGATKILTGIGSPMKTQDLGDASSIAFTRIRASRGKKGGHNTQEVQ